MRLFRRIRACVLCKRSAFKLMRTNRDLPPFIIVACSNKDDIYSIHVYFPCDHQV